jgi:hypothetical protein
LIYKQVLREYISREGVKSGVFLGGRIYKLGGAIQVYYVSLSGKNTLAHPFRRVFTLGYDI